ncbi:MAG: FAD linked oxidase domain protein [Methanothrix sp.]|jgi:FAD/FMN-containing dehydrogenase|nr:MAG: FAD linked oxidase domain protein [Methanothrix sp.]
MTRKIDQAALEDLSKNFDGEILLPDHPAYDEARQVYNKMIDRRPAVIAQCAGTEDVVRAVRFGLDLGLEIAVRSGGHSVAGWGVTDGGLMVDLRHMNAVEVDPEARIAHVAGGATCGDVARACEPYNLVTTGGTVSTTGVAGFALGGGWGYLSRKFGLACDNLLSVELVTYDGGIIVASQEEHPELFWALHGGGGNFGVATKFTFRLHPLPVATMALLIFPPEEGPKVVRSVRDLFEAGAPDELNVELGYLTAPPEEFVPPHLVNRLSLLVNAFYAGSESEARKALAPLFELGPEGEMIAQMSYADIQSAFDSQAGFRYYGSAELLPALPDEAVERFCYRALDMIVPSASVQTISSWGGAIARQAGDWPMASRDATWLVYPFGQWTDASDDERGIAWVRALGSDMAPYAADGTYINLITDEGRKRTIASYGGEANYRRLAAVKARYDPDNIFRLNHNIRPD